jgi:hypothetical protein
MFFSLFIYMSIQLQNLSNEFNTLISKYQDTYKKYIDVINYDNKKLTTFDNYAFYGKNPINTLNNTTIENCKSTCSSNSSCSGATFNTTYNNCTLTSGFGNLVQEQKSNAIVKEAMYYSYQLQKLNSKLMDINQQIINVSNNYDEFKKSQQKNVYKKNLLDNNYETLSYERTQIERMIREYETLNTAYENGNINVTSNYFTYISLLFIAILLIFLLLQFSFTETQRGGGNNNNLHNLYKLLPLGLSILSIYILSKTI